MAIESPSDLTALNPSPIKRISHSSARTGMLRKPAIGKVALALILACVLGAGVVGCNDNNSKTPGSVSTPAKQDVAAPAQASRASVTDTGNIPGFSPVQRVLTSFPYFQPTAMLIDEYAENLTGVVGHAASQVQGLSAVEGNARNADPLYNKSFNVQKDEYEAIIAGQKAWEQFKDLKPELDKMIAPMFKDKDLFARASHAVIERMVKEYGTNGTIAFPKGQYLDSVPNSQGVKELKAAWDAKAASYAKGIDPDSPNLGDVDLKSLTFAQ